MSEPISDSDYGFLEHAIEGTSAPKSITDALELIDVEYLSFDGLRHRGQIVMHADLANEVRHIFTELLAIGFPIEKVAPIAAYGWDDERSMRDNNSSGFNYRLILDTDQLSNHSFGRALDLNPALNPYIKDKIAFPSGAVHDPAVPGTISAGSRVVRIFEEKGWKWGSEYDDRIDYQHFAKHGGL